MYPRCICTSMHSLNLKKLHLHSPSNGGGICFLHVPILHTNYMCLYIQYRQALVPPSLLSIFSYFLLPFLKIELNC